MSRIGVEKGPQGRFEPYPAYKDSGVEWLGEIPAHWDAAQMWRISDATSGGTPAKEERGFWDGEVPWVSPKDMKRRFIDSSEDTITERALRETGIKLITPPVVLIVVRGMILAHTFPVAITTVPVTINQDMKALRFRQVVEPTFAAWLFEGVGRGILGAVVEEAAHGTKVIRMDRWRSVVAPVPPIGEQRAIAAFLDRETARIDALVAKKERLIELLQEKRTALITRAVTKGLDPTVPMKDSGVEWLGHIPAHWKVRRIAMAAVKITNGFVGPTRDILVNDGVRYLQSLHIKNGDIDFERRPYFVTPTWSRQHAKSVLAEGDVLVVQTGDVGQVAVVPSEFADCNCHALIIIRLERGVGVGQWLARALQSDYGQGALAWSQTGALHPHLECGHVREIRIAFPPLSEQKRTLPALAGALGRVDAMTAKVRDAIDRLKELRTALISAAVTGKIDVRAAFAEASASQGGVA